MDERLSPSGPFLPDDGGIQEILPGPGIDVTDGTGPIATVGLVIIEDGIDTVLTPELPSMGGGTRQAQNNFDGGTYTTFRQLRFNRAICRVNTVVTPGGRLEGAFYQAPQGLSGAAMVRLGTFTVDPVDVVGNVEVATSNEIVIVPGLYAVIWGASAAQGGNFSMSARVNAALSLLTVNVVAGTHPTAFTTALAVDGGAPASLDVPGQTPSSVDIHLSLRTRRV